MPTNDELVERLAFILKRSQSFANSSLTIEEIAEKMWWNDFVSEILSHPDGFNWAIKELRRGGGMDEIADLLADSRIVKKIQFRTHACSDVYKLKLDLT